MAKEKSETKNMSGYFRELFKANRSWLSERSNDKVVKRWLADHPEETSMPTNVKGTMSNIKSVMRKNTRRRAKSDEAEMTENNVHVKTAAPKVSKLEQLEIQIDDCVTMAAILDAKALEHVIRLLRKARNEVVWMQGQ